MTDLDFDTIADAVRAAGHQAVVQQTGGGVATIMIGTPTPDAHGDLRVSLLAGPGWFEGPGYTNGKGTTGDFYIGPDDDGADFHAAYDTPDTMTQDEVIAHIIDRMNKK